MVAIADVSHYVKPGSALDRAAIERGNSVYFPNRVIPMLPEKLSNGLCSINPQIERLCMVCDMRVSAAGKIKSYRFYDAVMRSHAHLIYDDVTALLEDDKVQHERYRELVPHLANLHKLFLAFSKARKIRGTIEFITTETLIRFGEDKKIESIVPLQRNVAHMIIEECMIAANICAAQFLTQHELPLLYRVHDTPATEKLTDLRAFLATLGLKLGGGEKPEAVQFAKVLEQVRGRPDAHLVQTVLLRSLNQAVYSSDNMGHFGLALEEYAHFTSPIRRYPDLLVHRAIRHALKNKKSTAFIYSESEMAGFGEHCSMTERRADEATRDVISWLKCEYMLDKVGASFDGIITGVTSFGFFVELDDIYVEGLVHVTALKNDYYHFDPVNHRLVGERTHNVFRLADKVHVRVGRVDLDEKRIDFEFISSYRAEAKRAAAASAPKKTKKTKAKAAPPAKKQKRVKQKAKAAKSQRKKAAAGLKKRGKKANTKAASKAGLKRAVKAKKTPALKKTANKKSKSRKKNK